MPRTVRPFNNRARADELGNVIPVGFDNPTVAQVLERTGDGGLAYGCRLTGDVDIEMEPFALGLVRTMVSQAAPYRPAELLLPEDPRRGAITIQPGGTAALQGGGVSWNVARTPHEALRDDSSLIFGVGGGAATPHPPACRFSWRQALWVVQRSGGTGALLTVSAEQWAR
jgi:hypothetical protein